MYILVVQRAGDCLIFIGILGVGILYNVIEPHLNGHMSGYNAFKCWDSSR